MSYNKTEHKIYWEINRIRPDKNSVLAKFLKLFNHTKIEVETYLIDANISVNEGDSVDSALDSILGQLKHISTQDEHKIIAHNGIRRIQFVRSDNV